MMTIKSIVNEISNFLGFELFKTKSYSLQIADIFYVVLVFIAVKFFLWLISKWIKRVGKDKGLEYGRQYAMFQIFRYLIWVIAFVLILDGIGINVTILLAGSAALLVGLGLGIQQTFNDFFSGIVLLIDGTVKVDDVIEVDGMVATVKEIGIRSSTVITRNDIFVLVPNSKFTSEKVVNWSHSRRNSRFIVDIGVAYDSDVELVKKCLLLIANSDERILKDPAPFVRLESFDDSAIKFALYFWSEDAFRIEQVKSDTRFAIIKAFREHKITIPFPQHDVYIKKNEQAETD